MLWTLLAALFLTIFPVPAAAQRSPVILSTTTSTQDSGLLDVLVPLFEQKTGYTVKTIAVGTGQALALAARGEADVVLAHAPALEKKYVADGKMLDRRLVMYNDFVIIGPADDPAKIKGVTKAADAMKAIAATGSRFVSRGDSPARICSRRRCGSWPASSRRAPGTSRRGRAWARRSASPTIGRPTP